MSSQAGTFTELPTSNEGDASSVTDQLTTLRRDVDHLKTESKSWVKRWGVYLGMLAALIAVPKGTLDLLTQLWQRSDTSVAIQGITIYHDPGLSSEILKFPLIVTNLGNLDDVLLNNGATLKVAGQSVELSDADFGLFDNGRKIGTSLAVPKEAVRAYDVAVTFNPRTRAVAVMPGQHTLELRFLGGKRQSYLASFCFPLQATDVHELFESNQYQQQRILVQCPDPGLR